MAFAPDFGLSREEAERISAAFGGGFSRLRETCGTVSGAAMVLSLRYGAGTGSDREKKTHLYTVVQDFAKAFAAQHGSYICRGLLALGPGPGFTCSRGAHRGILQPAPLREVCPRGSRIAGAVSVKPAAREKIREKAAGSMQRKGSYEHGHCCHKREF